MIRGLDALERRLRAISGDQFGVSVTKELAMSTVREAKLLVPRKTGNLGRSIHVGSVTPTTATIVASANYAAYVELGTRAHDIYPKNRRALRFAVGANRRLSGRPRSGAPVVFAKHVHHPGTRAQPFLVPGAKKAVSKAGLMNVVVKRWNDAA
jgi:hypothetical protein